MLVLVKKLIGLPTTVWMLLFLSQPQFVQANEFIPVSGKIKKVTVYPGQAQVTRIAQVNLPAGISKLAFREISPFIDMNSIQVVTEEGVNLIGVTKRTGSLEQPVLPEYIQQMQDSLEVIEETLLQNKVKRDAVLIEKEVLLANKQTGGTAAVLHADDLEETLNLFRKKMQDIGEEWNKLAKADKPLLATQKKFKKELDDYHQNHQNRFELIITVETAAAGTNANFEFSYLVSNCSWTPSYDIRIKDFNSPLQLISKASISQQTREDWNNIELRLSTSDPNLSGTKPELDINRIGFLEQQVLGLDRIQTKSNKAMIAEMGAPASADFAAVQHFETHIEFVAALPQSIPSDQESHMVDLTTSQFPAYYAYGSVPKIDAAVYATAKITANDLANQIPGNANIYFNGTFTGQTYLQTTSNDSLLISLGLDKRIPIERILSKSLSSRSCFGGTVKDVKAWEIKLRNTRKEKIQVIIEDQIPVSENAEIEVKLLEMNGALYDAKTGKLTWILTLDGEKSTSVNFSFEVKYPKDKTISPY